LNLEVKVQLHVYVKHACTHASTHVTISETQRDLIGAGLGVGFGMGARRHVVVVDVNLGSLVRVPRSCDSVPEPRE